MVDAQFRENLLVLIDRARFPFKNGFEKVPQRRLREGVLSDLVQIAIDLGIYPEKTGYENLTVQAMVEGWGARWNEYQEPHFCPHCQADLRNPKGPPFMRTIGISNGDSVHTWKCPDCQKTWKRT